MNEHLGSFKNRFLKNSNNTDMAKRTMYNIGSPSDVGTALECGLETVPKEAISGGPTWDSNRGFD